MRTAYIVVANMKTTYTVAIRVIKTYMWLEVVFWTKI